MTSSDNNSNDSKISELEAKQVNSGKITVIGIDNQQNGNL